jgi:hypothetical protein
MRRLCIAVIFLVLFNASPRAVPAAPVLAVSVTGSVVTLTWTANFSATGYRLEAGTAPGLSNAAQMVVGVMSQLSASAAPGTYYARVRAMAADGESAPSNEVVIVVGGTGGGGGGCMPNVPLGLAARVSGSVITLTWSRGIAGCAPTGYLLLVGSSTGTSDIATLSIAATSFSVSAPDGRYYFRVVALNGSTRSVPSNEVAVMVGSAPPAPPPGGGVEVNLATASIGSSAAGNAIVVGEVTNRGANTVAFTKVNVTFRNIIGIVVGTDYTYIAGRSRRLSGSDVVTDTTLAPGESGCFYLISTIRRTSVDRATFTVDGDVRTASNLTNTVALVGQPTRGTSLNRLRLTGEMRNNGSGLTHFNKAVFYIQRSDARAVECSVTSVAGISVRLSNGSTTSTGLLGGRSGSYDDLTDAPADAAAVTGWTMWDEGGATPADEHALRVEAAEASARGDRAQSLALQRELESQRQARDRLFRDR